MFVIEILPATLGFQVVCGPTGSGKSRLLHVLAAQGQQVLDLEKLAQHRGSIWGRLPGKDQPGQKYFDSELLLALQKMDPSYPVYVEAESNKIGQLTLPPALVRAMHLGSCLLIETPMVSRIAGLQEDYPHYIDNPPLLIAHLQALHRFHGEKQLQCWIELIQAGNFSMLVGELLSLHYDPSYLRATSKHYVNLPSARSVRLVDLSADTLNYVAASVVAERAALIVSC